MNLDGEWIIYAVTINKTLLKDKVDEKKIVGENKIDL